MKKKLPVTWAAILLSGCINPFESKDCGVLYDKLTTNMDGAGGNLLPDTWSDVTVASRSANQDHFFKNNTRMLTGKRLKRLILKRIAPLNSRNMSYLESSFLKRISNTTAAIIKAGMSPKKCPLSEVSTKA